MQSRDYTSSRISRTKLPNFSGKAFLAPMAGITDPAMRILCKQMGAALVATELTSIQALLPSLFKKTCRNFYNSPEEERPLVRGHHLPSVV